MEIDEVNNSPVLTAKQITVYKPDELIKLFSEPLISSTMNKLMEPKPKTRLFRKDLPD